MIISDILAYIGQLSIKITLFLGYPGIFILMAMESMIFPIPSELVMPFAGFLAFEGKFSFLFVVIASSLGSLFGSLISYYIGAYGGDRFVRKFGKYFLLDISDLEKTEKWFDKRGGKTIFISRFIPVVRHLISIPAGIGKMDIKKFCLYTLLGATIWNTFLAYLGFLVGQNWNIISGYMEYISIPIAIIIVLAGIFMIYRKMRDR
ncbi:DedA family protein [Candidatus Woesearchaeota archaeon]|nr:DedA family protein [Candidatus Woesearchaeota archaeon]